MSTDLVLSKCRWKIIGVLLTGGYGPSWKPQTDTWKYDIHDNEWIRLNMTVLVAGYYASAANGRNSASLFVWCMKTAADRCSWW